MHELSVGWLTPLDHARPTVAEFLGERGYATAGFVGNTFFCAADSGISRGFTYYQDFIFPELTALKTAVIVSRALDGFQTVVSAFAEDWLMSAGLLIVSQTPEYFGAVIRADYARYGKLVRAIGYQPQ